ncbi:uncharacterized protein LOC116199284 isoform X7 [Punica granatum]|uniref:Uncharacterized protein LOC116199284 isoform X7 n=1 Tax=Punica granatum TaxID=22663 RepID=A0A218W6B1_PUNGR|nr:uncharacterized protein LOC116199284 isoform X7 [Punica granatum]OWM68049.1 hypothetical protein CDL15_Pgr017617 [Punica granatum]
MSTDKGYGQPFAPRLVSTAMGTKEKAEGLLEHTVIAICDSPTPMASPGTGRDQQLRPTCYKQSANPRGFYREMQERPNQPGTP